MSNFVNSEYERIISELINDINYTGMSYRGKVASLRRYSEYIIRKLLDLEPDYEFTLGDPEVLNRLDSVSDGNRKDIAKLIARIKERGNNATHSEDRNAYNEEAYIIVMDDVLSLLSYLLVNYFDKYSLGSNDRVMTYLSLLPPVIRRKALSVLYSKEPSNVFVVDKYVLAIYKDQGVDSARTWIESHRRELEAMLAYTNGTFNSVPPELVAMILTSAPQNMYQSCLDKINALEHGKETCLKIPHYTTFEEAKSYYIAMKNDAPTDTEVTKFQDIMDFIYLGYKSDNFDSTDNSGGHHGGIGNSRMHNISSNAISAETNLTEDKGKEYTIKQQSTTPISQFPNTQRLIEDALKEQGKADEDEEERKTNEKHKEIGDAIQEDEVKNSLHRRGHNR